MGEYALNDKPFDGKPAYKHSSSGSKNENGNYLYWLDDSSQWNVGSPLGYSKSPWMYVKDSAAVPWLIHGTWNARKKALKSAYKTDGGVKVTTDTPVQPTPLQPTPVPVPTPPPSPLPCVAAL